ncbi:MAG: RNA ligase family protein [Epibacterium sp.]|nr:RNA ligase family protein [Epibacterium sp.]NQX75554.1 hypothetical protein [Epibacterium sp.]
MSFIKYQHVERLGSPETEGILDLIEPCHVFPKLDGTNGSIWCEEGQLCFGSRNRQVSLDYDNQGFMESLHNSESLRTFFAEWPDVYLYGEWLVPHTIKGYVDEAWRTFYVFDVCRWDNDVERMQYIPYEEYKDMLDRHGIEYIPCIAVIDRPNPESLIKLADKADYLMPTGEVGEGIVIKRYGFVNSHGRTVWAKVVRNEFKAMTGRVMGPAKMKATKMVEEEIVRNFLSEAMVDKVVANIMNEENGWHGKFIPRLLHTVFYDLVREECWNFVKAHKNPTINFGHLQRFTFAYVKTLKPELF